MKWGLKGGISIDADSGPHRYVLWCCGEFVKKTSLLFRLALAILWKETLNYPQTIFFGFEDVLWILVTFKFIWATMHNFELWPSLTIEKHLAKIFCEQFNRKFWCPTLVQMAKEKIIISWKMTCNRFSNGYKNGLCLNNFVVNTSNDCCNGKSASLGISMSPKILSIFSSPNWNSGTIPIINLKKRQKLINKCIISF